MDILVQLPPTHFEIEHLEYDPDKKTGVIVSSHYLDIFNGHLGDVCHTPELRTREVFFYDVEIIARYPRPSSPNNFNYTFTYDRLEMNPLDKPTVS